jgi:hypothetical protein
MAREDREATVKKEAVWTGPNGAGKNGGVTQSILGRFLTCRERTRLYLVQGLRPVDSFNHRLEYGNLFHKCEESGDDWPEALKQYARLLCRKYPTDQEQVDRWYMVCRVQYPIYLNYWKNHPDTRSRKVLMAEAKFDVPYKLPSGREVRLRGMWDSYDLIGRGRDVGVYITDHKTKGDVNPEEIKRNLLCDLQTMFYLVAAETWRGLDDYGIPVRFPEAVDPPLRGVRYNVIRRPLSGGKGTIKQHKPTKSNPQGESREEFYARLGELIREEPEHYFMRWRVEVRKSDILTFRRECLDPILEQLCDWWCWIENAKDPFDCFTSPTTHPDQAALFRMLGKSMHWRTPFNFNPIAEGIPTDLDEYLSTGSVVGLTRTETLMPELEE